MLKRLDQLRNKNGFNSVVTFFGCLYLSIWNWIICYTPSYAVRHFVLKNFYGVKVGRNVYIHMGVKFLKPWGVTIGNNVNIQMGSFIDGRGGITIEDNVDITIGVKILTQQHNLQDSFYTTDSRPVYISTNSVIGSFSLIMPGVTIGKGSVIGAGSVVSKSIPEWSIAVGNPCVVKKNRSQEINYTIGYARPFH
ncbi:DapH/DapD/GlmU-related protein [Pseudomonas silesiensis]|uniref:acyltransferase n=1 Tax=Pseudomonas silesiensis TaxID=1853130 RepID=UPI0030CECF99